MNSSGYYCQQQSTIGTEIDNLGGKTTKAFTEAKAFAIRQKKAAENSLKTELPSTK
jgi:hypothetical protein